MLNKTLQDSDSLYCVSDDCTSNQTSFFIGQTTDAAALAEMNALFGDGFADNDYIEMLLTKRGLIKNLLCHFIRQTRCFKRKDSHGAPPIPWNLDVHWLDSAIQSVEKCIKGDVAKFKFQIHRENAAPCRVYLKGLKNLSADGGATSLDLQGLIFSGDRILLERKDGELFMGVEHQDDNAVKRVDGWLLEMGRACLPLPAQEDIDIQRFVAEFIGTKHTSKLMYDDQLMKRFVGALLTKPFVVLTGLSGSGKTNIAQLFVEWMKFKIVGDGLLLKDESFKEGAYTVVDSDEFDYKILVTETGKIRTVSKNAVQLWLTYLKNNPDKIGTDSKEIRKTIQAIDPLDDNYMHGSDAILNHIACGVLSKRDPFADRLTNNCLLVPVGADWTNSEHLLGYPDALQPGKYVMPETGVLKLMLDARDNPKLPFFLILDEMNLSHVERYFADFLSAMESGEDIKLYGGDNRSADGIKIPQTLKFPKNLFIIGTMNVDETTYMFSPKVLDRAQVIEFRVSEDDMKNFLTNPSTPNLAAIESKGAKYAEAFLKLKDAPPALDAPGSTTNKDAIAAALNKFFPELVKLGAEFGYRSAGEIVRFCAYYLAAGATIDDAIDAAIVQKLLPKLHGSQARLGPVLRKLKELATKEETVTLEGGETKKVRTPLYTLTCEKLDRMLDRLKANGFTSFAEA